MTQALFLSSSDVDGVASPDEFVEAVREGYRQHGEGAPARPRTRLLRGDPPGMLTDYAAVLPETGVMGGYMYAAGFAEQDAWFMTPLFDAESGEPLAVLDGASMNPFKTGATGAVGVDALARDDAETLAVIGSGAQARGQLRATATVRDFERVDVFSPTREHRESFATDMDDAETLAVIGSGAQARGQLRATATVRDFERVDVFSPTRDHRESFATDMDDLLEADVRPVESSVAAIEGADVVITATNASQPVFDGDRVEPGTHVTAMGQYNAEKRELDTTTIERATYVPDLRERIEIDAGSFIHAVEEGVIDESHVHAELGEVVAGTVEGRSSADEITVFDSGGTGIETVAGGALVYERALNAGLGTEIEFAPASEALTGR